MAYGDFGRTAAGQGFEPRLAGSGPAVLPVRRSGIAVRAPPGTRTPFPGLRVQCITRHACGAQRSRVDHRGLEPRTSCLRHRHSSDDELAAHAPGPRPAQAGRRARRQCVRPAGRTDVSHCAVDNVQAIFARGQWLRWTEGIEPSTIGFGDRSSTVELRPREIRNRPPGGPGGGAIAFAFPRLRWHQPPDRAQHKIRASGFVPALLEAG